MNTSKVLLCLVFIFALKINLNTSNPATLPAIGNDTVESTAIAKASNTAIVDIFEDIRWFFDRLAIFCEMMGKLLPPEKKLGAQTQLSIGLTFESGMRHFIYGVREISKSIVSVLSDKEVREYKQLSRATDYAQDMVRSVGDFFRKLRIFVGNAFATFTFYVPEFMLTKCMGNYLLETYPDRHYYEFPIILVNDIVDTFRTPIEFENEMSNNVTANVRKLGWRSHINFEKNVEQNEILDEDMYVFNNTPVSPSPELLVKNEEQSSSDTDEDNEMEDFFGLKQKLEDSVAEVPSWKKCVQMYATETIFRKLEHYFLEVKQ